MDAKYKEIVENAIKLAEMAVPAFEAEAKLKEVEFQLKEASKKVASIESDEGEFRSKINKMADVFVTRGIIDDKEKSEFVEKIASDHKQLIDVAIGLSEEITAASFGKAASESASAYDSLDPFERGFIDG